jgi:hypothetical protein
MHLDWVHEVLYSLGRDWINWQEDAYTNHRPVTDLFSSNLTGNRLAWASNMSVREVLRALLMAVVASLCNLLNSLRALTEPVFFLLPSGLWGSVYQTLRPYVILIAGLSKGNVGL